MDNYIYIGYDIWSKPQYSSSFTNIDTWECDDFYEKVISVTGIKENFLQLLNPKNKSELSQLCHLLNNEIEKCVLILVAIEESVYKSLNTVEPTFIDDLSFSLIGYDICDIDGFFSLFDMGLTCVSRKNLLQEDEMGEAKIIINLGNVLIPEHAPFHLVKLCKVITQ